MDPRYAPARACDSVHASCVVEICIVVRRPARPSTASRQLLLAAGLDHGCLDYYAMAAFTHHRMLVG